VVPVPLPQEIVLAAVEAVPATVTDKLEMSVVE
jgi:hypothetical protein